MRSIGRLESQADRRNGTPKAVKLLQDGTDAPIRLELRKGTAVVTMDWPASSAAACGAWLREWLG